MAGEIHRPHQSSTNRPVGGHFNKLARQSAPIGDLFHGVAAGKLGGDARDDIPRVPAVAQLISAAHPSHTPTRQRTRSATPTVQAHASPRHAIHHTNRRSWNKMTASA